MVSQKSITIQAALDVIEQMPIEDQMAVVEVLQHRLTAYRRSEIAQNALDARKSVREKRAQYGNVDDLKRDLNA
jgi:hypothetical protein